jgi:hypothetical protein
VSHDFQDYYYFLAAVGRKTNLIATQLVMLILRTLPLPDRLLLVIDDSPTKRYGPKVEGADVHHNPTPGPADQPFLYGHIWVTISLALRHPAWGAMGLPLLAMLYVRKQTLVTIPKVRGWQRFATKLQLAARLVEWIVPILKRAGKTVWIVVDGGYTKRPFLRRVLRLSNVTIVGRLRKDAALRDMPPKRKKGQRRARGRPRKYAKNRLSLAKRAGQQRGWQTITCTVYGETTTKTYKTFRGNPPVGSWFFPFRGPAGFFVSGVADGEETESTTANPIWVSWTWGENIGPRRATGKSSFGMRESTSLCAHFISGCHGGCPPSMTALGATRRSSANFGLAASTFIGYPISMLVVFVDGCQ